MCFYLDWELTVDNDTLSRFEQIVKKDFSNLPETYSSYPVELVSKRTIKAAASTSNARASTLIGSLLSTTTLCRALNESSRKTSLTRQKPTPSIQSR